MSPKEDERKEGKSQTFEYFVDDETQVTVEHQLSARQIMLNAGIDTLNHYLVWIHGNAQTSYQENPDEMVHIHEKMRFISVFTGETPVS
jgi:hypothetical protein